MQVQLQDTHSEDLRRCEALRREEREVVESIYPDYISDGTAAGVVKLEIPVELAEAAYIADSDRIGTSSDVPGTDEDVLASSGLVSLSSLPPLLLEIILPPLYPLHRAPMVTSVHATHSWLPVKALFLQKRMTDLWQEGEGVLYTWIEWIRSGEFLEALNLTADIDGQKYIQIPHPALRLLVPLLIAHDTAVRESHFSEASYPCEICLTSIRGARCVRLSCGHVFCRSCLEEFWGLHIREGDVARVGCADVECVKAAKEASEEEVRRVMSEEEVQRWKWLRLKRSLDRDPTLIHCPLSFCQTPVPQPQNVEEGTGWVRLRTCPECGFSFCAFCRRTWHGPISDCVMPSTEGFVLEYLEFPEGSPGRDLMERRFGKANIRKMLARYEEEQANKKLIDSSTTACPSCRIKVEKSVGCNHMTCTKCRQHFCYRCGDKLPASDPYRHFSTPGHRCFSKLFDYESIDNEWQPVEGFDLP